MPQIEPRLSAFLRLCDGAARDLGISRSTLSTKLFTDGKRLDTLNGGKSDIGIRRLAAAEVELATLVANHCAGNVA